MSNEVLLARRELQREREMRERLEKEVPEFRAGLDKLARAEAAEAAARDEVARLTRSCHRLEEEVREFR